MGTSIEKRILSAILAAITLLSLVVVPGGIAVETTAEDPNKGETAPNTADREPVYDYDTLEIMLDGVQIHSLDLLEHEKITVTAQGIQENARYQWQILHPEQADTWVNIYDATEAELAVTAALVKNMLDDEGRTKLRCRAYTDSTAYLTAELTVTLVRTLPGIQVAVPTANSAMDEPETPTEAPEFVTVQIQYVQYGFTLQDDDTLKEVELGEAFTPYIATLKSGTNLNASVLNPTIMGFSPTLTRVEVGGISRAPEAGEIGDTDATKEGHESVNINLSSIHVDVVYIVEYHPAKVPYEVRYFFQNIYDDLYVENSALAPTVSLMGLTGTRPDEKYTEAVFPGFTSLYYEPETIAADGSTVFNVYYERDYYLMEFDCNGGYGTDTIYVRYDTFISIPIPVRMGYQFLGWDLIGNTDTNGDEGAAGVNPLPEKLPAHNSSYIAIWTTVETKYTIVYWAENANDPFYSYWGHKEVEDIESATELKPLEVANAHPADTVDEITDESYFKLNTDKTLASNPETVTVAGDASTIINLYYTRNTYTLSFTARGKCAMEPHTHVTDMESKDSCYMYICGEEEHIHQDECLSCTTEEHIHSDACCALKPHKHGAECCDLVPHKHGAECCTKTEHITHDTSCYDDVGNQVDNRYLDYISPPSNPKQGEIYKWEVWNRTSYYIYVGSNWYSYNGELKEGIAPTICGKDIHEHGPTCTLDCGYSYEHTHDTGECNTKNCGNEPEHTHGTGSCVCKENKTEHKHDENCYGNCTYGGEHKHTAICIGLKCNKTEHTHKDSCRTTSSSNKEVYSITAKYGQDIRDHFPVKSEEGSEITADYTGYWWKVPAGSPMLTEGKYIMSLDQMPGMKRDVEKMTLPGTAYDTTATIYYYVESLTADTAELEYEGKNFEEWKTVVTEKGLQFTYSEDFHPIEGFTQWKSDPVFNNSNSEPTIKTDNYFYYSRNSYELNYYNYNAEYGTPKNVKYETSLNDAQYNIGKPDYPAGLEPGAYDFKGWFTTAGCYPGTEVKWEKMTMPANDVTLYAKWEPVKRNVYFYLLYTDIKESNYWYGTDKDGNKVPAGYPIVVDHGTLLGTTYSYEPKREGYTFIGWFYMDEDNKKRFAPDTMEIRRDLHLFAEWRSEIDTSYEITYVLKETTTPVAEPTEGHSSAGKTKTFAAKAGVELLKDYQDRPLFPTINSHSILMEEQDAEKTKNKYQFEYVEDAAVYYKVKYLNKIDSSILHEEKIVVSNKAIVTEKFVPIEGFLPEKYYIRKVLASDDEYGGSIDHVMPENEIIFYYTPDSEHGLYTVQYYKQTTDGGDYELAQSVVGHADIGETISADPLPTFPGFAYNKDKDYVLQYTPKKIGTDDEGKPIYEYIEDVTTTPGVHKGTVTVAGLEIKVYYDRIKYDYQVQYVEYGTTNVLYSKLYSGDEAAMFDSKVDHTAPDTYDHSGLTYLFYPTKEKPKTQEITIRINPTDTEGNVTSVINVMTFYYEVKKTTVLYEAVCTVPDSVDFGAVTLNRESAAVPSSLSGSEAVAGEGYRFMGWYYDPEMTKSVPDDWVKQKLVVDNRGTPETGDDVTYTHYWLKPGNFTGVDQDKNTLKFYAVFEPVLSKLTVSKKLVDVGTGVTDSFLFHIKGTGKVSYIDMIVSIQGNGTAVIDRLPVGTYEVAELTQWSWEYTAQKSNFTLVVTESTPGNVEFTNTYEEADWLNGESRIENDFTQA